MVDKKLSQFDEVSTGDVEYFPVLDNETKNKKVLASNIISRTNCFTEIRQDINLSLTNGTLTLIAGSKVYVPNGVGVFDSYTLSSDAGSGDISAISSDYVFFVDSSGNLAGAQKSNCYSGTAEPTGSSGVFWYDTTNNVVKRHDGTDWVSGFSLPFCVVSSGASSIEQTFNGFGYIGNTRYVLPGVKGLLPNGRNADGTLKNTAFSIESVLTATSSVEGSGLPLMLKSDELSILTDATYNEESNLNVNSSGANLARAIVGTWSADSNGAITGLKPKNVFRIQDADESVSKHGDTMDGALKIGADSNEKLQLFFKNHTKGSLPSSTVYTSLEINDKNNLPSEDYANTRVGVLEASVSTTGNVTTTLAAYKNEVGSTTNARINIVQEAGGAAYATAPTPSSTGDNSTKISTTAWFNNKVKVVSSLPSSPDSNVYYFVTG